MKTILLSTPMSRRALLLGFASAALLFSSCTKPAVQSLPGEKTTLVQLAPVNYSSDAVPIASTGSIARRTESALSFKVGGIVESVNVRAGDAVEKDQVL